MAKGTPIAPATETSPQTEAFTKKDIVLDLPEMVVPLPKSAPLEVTEQDDDSWFSTLFDDDDDYVPLEERQIEDSRMLPSKDDFKAALNLTKESRDPIESQFGVVDSYSTKKLDIEQYEKESELEPIEIVKTVASSAYKSAVPAQTRALNTVLYTTVSEKIGSIAKAGGFLLGNLEYADVPRSETWTTGYLAGSALPDTDTFTGDALEDLAGKGFSGAAKLYDFFASDMTSNFRSDQQEEDYYKDIQKLGENIYSAFADKTLYNKAIQTPGYFIDRPDAGILHGGNATGEDLLNIAFPIDMMRRLEANAPAWGSDKTLRPDSTAFKLKALSDPVTRMGLGLALEVAVDPLWFFGSAKATQVVHTGGKAYHLSRSGSRVAGLLERYSNVVGSAIRHRKTVVKAINGADLDEVSKAQAQLFEVSDNALSEAREAQVKAAKFQKLSESAKSGNIDEAVEVLKKEYLDEVEELKDLSLKYSGEESGKLVKANYTKTLQTIERIKKDIELLSSGTPEGVRKALLSKAKNWIDTARTHRAAASEIRSFLDVVNTSGSAKAAGLVEKSKIPLLGTVHVPFAESTYTVGTKGQIETAAKYINTALGPDSRILTPIRTLKEGYETLSSSAIGRKISAARDAGYDALAYLSPGERLAYISRIVSVPFREMTYNVADTMADMLGTRHWQGLVASESLKAEMAYLGNRSATMMGLTPAESGLVRMKRLRPELWESYQAATTNYMKQLSFETANAALKIKTMWTLAGGTDGKGGALAEWKKRIKTRDLPLLDSEIESLVVSIRKSNSTSQIDILKKELNFKRSQRNDLDEIISDEYTIEDFMQEVARLHETGAGKIQDNPWLQSIHNKWSEIESELSQQLNKPTEEIRQALIAMLRYGERDDVKTAGIVRRLQNIGQLKTSPGKADSAAKVSVDEITTAQKVRLNSKTKLLNSVTTKKLTEILYRTLEVSGEAKFNNEIAKAIDNALLKALDGDRDLADEILTYAGAYYGKSPEESLKFLALEYSGEAERIKEQIKTGNLRARWPSTKKTPTAEPHPFWSESTPDTPGIDSTITIEEFAQIIKNKDLEHAAFFDFKTGKIITYNIGEADKVDPAVNLYSKLSTDEEKALQAAQKLRSDQAPDEFFEKLTELVATGDVVAIHNHPISTSKSAIAEVFTEEGIAQFPELSGLKPSFDSVITNIPPSIEDMKYTIAINAKYHLVVNPDGTAWLINRPRNGWPLVSNDSINFRKRMEEIEINLNRVDDSSSFSNRQINDDLAERYRASDEALNDQIILMIEDLQDLKESFDNGLLSLKAYKTLRQNKVDDWSSTLINKQFRELTEIELDVFQEYFGIKPFRVNLPGRFKSKSALLLGDTADVAKIERRIVRDRIKNSIQDAKLKTQATLNEIRDYRLNPEGSHRLTMVSSEAQSIVDTRYANSIDEFDEFASRHNFLNEESEEALYDELVRWVESDFPEGVAIPGVSRSAGDWLIEKAEVLELPESIVARDIDDMKRSILRVKQVEDSFRERISILTKASKRLERTGGPLTKGQILKDKAKLRKQLTENVIRNLLKDSPDEATAIVRVRNALDELLDLPDDPIFTKVKDEMSEVLVKKTYKKTKVSDVLAEAKASGKSLAAKEVEKLKKELAESIPRLKIPNLNESGTFNVKPLEQWEVDVWDRFNAVTANLSEEEVLLTAYAALSDSPKLFNAKTLSGDYYKELGVQYGKIKERYENLVGRRMEEIPEELQPVVDAFKGLIEHYQDLYIKYGMDFVKSPVDMMKMWGTVNYAPHEKLTLRETIKGEPIRQKLSSKAGYKASVTARSLEDAFSANMDQRKYRKLSGTMAELNDALNGKDGIYGIDPMNLASRFMKAARVISGEEFMFSLISTGVMKPISSKTVYDSMIEELANKYKLYLDREIDTVASDVLDIAVRNKATKSELKTLDDALEAAEEAKSLNLPVEMVPSAQRAADMNYVPVFRVASPKLSGDLVNIVNKLTTDLIISGDASSWARIGLTPDNVLELFQDMKTYTKDRKEDLFAKFTRESTTIRNSDKIIATLSEIKADNFLKNEELYNPLVAFDRLYSEELNMKRLLYGKRGKSPDEIASLLAKEANNLKIKSWDRVADEMNAAASAINSQNRVSSGESLKTFYTEGQELWNLYLPAVVKTSMDNLFVKSKFLDNWAGDTARKFNNFWKIRTTIIASAFHARNFTSNQLSNVLDVGAAMLDPAVALEAGRLTTLSHVFDRYGSIEGAKKVLGMKRGLTESAARFNKRKTSLSIINSLGADKGFDLGDGVIKTADEAIEILRERGVVSGGMQQFVDIDLFESSLADVYASAGVKDKLTKAKKVLSFVEDGMIVGLPMLIAGMPIPVGLPKGFGSAVGRTFENHARISNFIINTKKTLSYDTAAKHVDKFLFNYGDLTQKQKGWMRLLVPFFTWTQKNVALQLDMMQKNPIFYANFQRLLIHQGPEIVERYNAETLGIPYIPRRGSSKESLAFQDAHVRNLVRFPVPGQPGYYIEGLGLPQEAFFQQIEDITQLSGIVKKTRLDRRKPHLKMIGQTHFALKLAYELAEQRSAFFDRPMADMTYGRDALTMIKGIRRIPLVGNGLSDFLATEAGLVVTQPWRAKSASMMDDVHINGTANWVLNNTPWSRVMKEGAAAATLYNLTYLDRMPRDMREDYLSHDYEPIAPWWKIADAVGTIRIVADNPEARQARYNRDINIRREALLKDAGISGSVPIRFIKDNK